MTGDRFLWETPPPNFQSCIQSLLCFNMNALLTKSDLRAEKKKTNKKKDDSAAGLARRGLEKCVFCRHVQHTFRRLHYLTSQVKLYYGSCSVSYIRRRKNLELQCLKSPDGTKHAFVKVHLHYTDFIFSPSSQSHSALAF